MYSVFIGTNASVNFTDPFYQLAMVDYQFPADKNITCIGSPVECAEACLSNTDFYCQMFKHIKSSLTCFLYQTRADPHNASHLIWNVEDSNLFIINGKENVNSFKFRI